MFIPKSIAIIMLAMLTLTLPGCVHPPLTRQAVSIDIVPPIVVSSYKAATGIELDGSEKIILETFGKKEHYIISKKSKSFSQIIINGKGKVIYDDLNNKTEKL